MKIIGFYRQPTGPDSSGAKIPFYDKRWKLIKNPMLNTLGNEVLQVKVENLGKLVWINIPKHWILSDKVVGDQK